MDDESKELLRDIRDELRLIRSFLLPVNFDSLAGTDLANRLRDTANTMGHARGMNEVHKRHHDGKEL